MDARKVFSYTTRKKKKKKKKRYFSIKGVYVFSKILIESATLLAASENREKLCHARTNNRDSNNQTDQK